jgi:hypothetical protein
VASSAGPSPAAGPSLRQLTTPRAAALAGVLSALLFAAVLILIRVKMPEGLGDSTQWLNSEQGGILTATKLMPFAGITFLWFIGVVRDGFGRYEDRFFATVFLGSGLLFLAIMFVSTAVAAALVASNIGVTDPAAHAEVIAFGKMIVVSATKNLRHPDGGGVHDFAGHHLAQDWADAALAGRRQLSGGAGVGDRQ